MAYMMGHPENRCVFCEKPKENQDKENLILWRGDNCFVILNLFPYNNGHLMVVPYRHVADLAGLQTAEKLELVELTERSISVLREAMSPQGFNIGMNLGKVSGAGIDDHLHIHIVPRWGGDTNFMPVLSDTKVVSESLAETYARLGPHFIKQAEKG